MPWYVNKQLVPEALIRQEAEEIAKHPVWTTITDEAERERAISTVAVQTAQNKILVAQEAAKDPRPVDPKLVAQHVARAKANGNCREAYDDSTLRQLVEQSLRVERFLQEIAQEAPQATAEEVEAFYNANRERFRGPERFRAAHIVKHVNELRTEEQAEAEIAVALAELDGGGPFEEVAERHSDCKGTGGEIPEFVPGEMVPEFEEAVRGLEPGRYSRVFLTDFGFHIGKLIARIPPGAAPFEDCRQDIKNTLTAEKTGEGYQRKAAELRSRADIRFVPDDPAPQ